MTLLFLRGIWVFFFEWFGSARDSTCTYGVLRAILCKSCGPTRPVGKSSPSLGQVLVGPPGQFFFFVVPGQEPAATRVQFHRLHVGSLMFESVPSQLQQRVEEQIIETKIIKPGPHSAANELVEVFKVFSQIFFHGVPRRGAISVESGGTRIAG